MALTLDQINFEISDDNISHYIGSFDKNPISDEQYKRMLEPINDETDINSIDFSINDNNILSTISK